MASKVSQQIRVDYTRAKKGLIDSGFAKTLARYLGGVALDLERRRINSGIDSNGRPIRKLKRSYREQKRKMIAGKIKMKDRRTPYAARSVDDHGRLSGFTMSNRKVKSVRASVNGSNISAEFTLGWKSKKGEQRAAFLKRRRRNLYGGLARAGTAQGDRERQELQLQGKRFMRANNSAIGRVFQVDI